MVYAEPHLLWTCHPSHQASSLVHADGRHFQNSLQHPIIKKKYTKKLSIQNSPSVPLFLKQENLHQALRNKYCDIIRMVVCV